MTGKVMIVDDEPHITRNLEKVIPWEMLGLEVAATAKNGREALEALQGGGFDLLLCDIRMPVMDGMTLVKTIRDTGMDLDIIMLSGYQDFSYTRTAIQYGVQDYILKPIPYDELTGVIARVMSQRRARQRQQQDERVRMSAVLDLANEKVLFDVLKDYTDVSHNHWLVAEDEHELSGRSYLLLVLDMDAGAEEAKDWREWNDKERKLWNFAVANVLRESLRRSGMRHAVIQMRDGEWCVLAAMKEGYLFDRGETAQWIEKLLEEIRRHVKLSLHAGVWGDLVDMKGLSSAYKRVHRSMQLDPEAERIRFFSGEALPQNVSHEVLWSSSERILEALKRGHAQDVNEEMKLLSSRLQSLGTPELGRIKPVLHYFALHLMREMKEMQLLGKEQEEALWRKLDRRISAKDLLSVIRQTADAGLAGSSDKKKHSERTIAEAKAYLDRNLYRDIGVEEAATRVGLSTSYFSLLFKQTYGETFIEYVTRQRMEKAKQLLEHTSKSVAQISKEVGYSERRYFTKVFMKYTGENPTDFRARLQQPG
ncbi:response regulator [Paenibacillus albicereus]|uniref:Response regulator n=1 Tax=Paenibacillus albicereus TaxID=2726185 RepID=A0A6H2GVM0_9BACL|nr:response regulator [Paenibacillus albicereus]QJC51445.1 response regulator [Paenibacillus albicereus]